MAEALRRALGTSGRSERKQQGESVAGPRTPQPTSTRQSDGRDFKKALQAGSGTQFSDFGSNDHVELVLGLDFGTSCTKVVIQDVARRAGYAVSFDALSESDHPYLLPTIVSIDDEGEFNLQRRGREFRGLKQNMMAIAAKDPDERQEHQKSLLPHTMAYLALVFRASRAWFFKSHKEDYGDRRIDWRVNIGLPASRFDEPGMPMLYRSVIRRAWYLSTLAAPITFSLAHRVWSATKISPDRSRHDNALGPEYIGAFPEVVAAVQGYARSPERQEGLHLLVDAGASTMDVTCFRLLEYEHEDRYPIFFAKIARLGGFELFKFRGAHVSNAVANAIARLESEMDGVSAPRSPLSIKFHLNEAASADVDADFGNRIGETIWQVIAETKSKKDPSAREWTGRLPTFLCGGASTIDLYQQALDRIDKNTCWKGHLEHRDLMLPGIVDAPGVVPSQRHRLLVAYGLSFNPLDIGRLIPPSGIPDPEEVQDQKQFTEAFVSKEMV